MKLRIKNLKLIIRKTIAITLITVILVSTLKFVIFKPKLALADSLFTFNEGYGTSINDSNGNVTAGTITNAVWKTDDLCFDSKCLYFDGSGDFVSFTDDADLDFIAADNFTLQGWFRTPDITSGQRTIIAKHNSTAGGYKVYMDLNGYLIFGTDDDSSFTPDDSASTSTKTFDDNNWHHFAAVKTGTTSITIYIDGIQYQTDSSIAGTGTLANADTYYIGIDGNGSSNPFSGFLDEIKVYRSARTSAEIKADYLGENPSRGVTASFTPNQEYISNGLVGYWKLDETSGNATDYSGNNLTLTNNGTATFLAAKFGNGSEHVPASSQHFSTATTINGVKSVSFWTNPDSTTNYYVSLTSGAYITSSSGTLSATGFTNPKIFVDGVETTTITANSWQLVTITTETSINANQFYIGRQGSNYYDGTMDEARVYNRALSPAEVAKLYSWSLGPVGHWKMDENTGTTANDSSGLDNFGTLTNSPSWTIGKFGGGVSFAGSNQHIIKTDDSDFDFGTGASFSYSAWIKHSTASALEMIIDKYDSTAGNGGFKLYMESDGDLTCGIDDDETSFPEAVATSTLATYDDNNWHHINCVKDGTSTLNLYIDGVLITSTSISGVTGDFANADPLYLGIAEDGTSNDWVGQIDDVKIYNYARTSGQIIEDMNGGHPAPGSPIGSSVAYWKMDEGYGTTANDNSINSNNLTLSSTSWTNSGKFGKAWNGTGALWVSRANDADLDFTATEDFTLTGWFKSDSSTNPANGTEYILSTSTGNTDVGYQVYAKIDGTICFAIDDDGTWTDVESCTITDYYDGTWHHFTAVRNTTSDTIKIYIDAVEEDSDTDPTTGTLDGNNVFYLGDFDGDNNVTTDTEEFEGDIDEVKIFRSALSSNAIKVLHNQSSSQNLGTLSTNSLGNPSNSASYENCPPGNTETNCGSGDPSPTAYYKMDEGTGTTSVFDTSGNNFSGTLTGNMTEANWVTGKKSKGLEFDGIDDYADIGDVLYSDTISVSVWIKPDVLPSNRKSIITKRNSSGVSAGSNELEINIRSTGVIEWAAWNAVGTGIANTFSTTTLTAGQWYHITTTHGGNGGMSRVYINGVLEDNDAITDTIGNTSSRLQIGAISAGDSTRYFDGTIDDLKIYTYERTPAQVAWDYSLGRPTAWYRFDENTGSPTTLNDASGRSNNGTASGSMDASDWVSGKLNTSLDFDGSDDAVSVTNSNPIDLNLGLFNGFTYSAWIYPRSDGELDAGRIFQKGSNGSTTDTSTTFCRTTGESSGRVSIECRVDLATTDATFTLSSAIPTNAWSHIAFSWVNDADDEVTIWINGVPNTSTASFSGDATSESGTFYIGGNGTTNTRAFDGLIDDFRIYSYELSAQQIKTVMNNDSAVKY